MISGTIFGIRPGSAPRQRRAVARNCLGGLSLALRMAQRGIDFGGGGLGQRDDPAAIGDEIRGAPGAGVADRGGEDGRRRVARDAVHGKSASLHRDPSFHEIARFALSIDSGEGSSIAGLELTAHQAQHVILDRSTCSRNPVPMLVAHFLGHYGEAAERIRTESRAARMGCLLFRSLPPAYFSSISAGAIVGSRSGSARTNRSFRSGPSTRSAKW